ncbi:MAG: hypothetical protein WCX12_03420 [Candidatus Paceibacterota bacterium]|jgi:DnaK suppressor protein
MALTKEEIQKYKEELERKQREVSAQIAEHEKSVDLGDDVDSEDEEADEVEERGNQVAIVKALEDNLDEIEKALGKIEAGRYEKCDKCGGEITKEVFDAAPESLLCRECKMAS